MVESRQNRSGDRYVMRRVLACIVAVAAPVTAAAIYLLKRSRLPDPLPTHWNAAGVVDGTTGVATFVSVMVSTSAVFAIAAVVVSLRASRSGVWPYAAGSAALAGAVPAGLVTMVLLLSAGAARADEVDLSGKALWGVFAVAVALGIVVAVLVPTIRSDWEGQAVRNTVDTAKPGSSHRTPAVWKETVRSNVFAGIGLVCGVASIALLIAGVFLPPLFAIAATPVIGALVALGTYKIMVTIGPDGIRVDWGLLRWPHTIVPIDQIRGVRTDAVKPLHWGGWGYRSAGEGVGVIIRGGPALVVDRRHSSTIYITLPHADDAAHTLIQLLTHDAN